jgi:hypothetical protein
MDGKSWKDELINQNTDWSEDRCVYLEIEFDRAVVCGCFKVIKLLDPSDRTTSGTVARGSREGFTFSNENYFNLCDNTGTYVTSPGENPEQDGTASFVYQTIAAELEEIADCYMDLTDPGVGPDYSAQCSALQSSSLSPAPNAPPTKPPAGPSMSPSSKISGGFLVRMQLLLVTCLLGF